VDKLRAPTGRNGRALVVACIGSQSMHKLMPNEREWISVLCFARMQIGHLFKSSMFLKENDSGEII
jgi:hypothetical protein